MLKVLQITTFFNEHGGVEKSVSDLSHALADRHAVSVLCTTGGPTVRRASGAVSVTAAGSVISISGRPLSGQFAAELKKHEADVAHYHLPCPMAIISHPFVQPKAKIKVATWHHDLVRHQLFNNAMRPLMHRFLDSLDSIIVTAPALIESTPILRHYRNKCTVIPLGIDEQRFSSIDQDAVLEARAKFGGPLILYVGRLVYYKGCAVLVKAMAAVPNAQLVMIGTGPLHGDLVQLIKEAGMENRIHLLGWQSEDVLRTLLHACDVFVLPSTLSTECFGLVQVEAMLCGKPVINTQLPTGVPWVSIDGETGLTVQPGDTQGLAKAIETLVADDRLRRKLGANARIRAHQMFTLDRHVASTVELYERLLSKSKSPARQTAHTV
jgi:rhamnosyl/mannosyltransferase